MTQLPERMGRAPYGAIFKEKRLRFRHSGVERGWAHGNDIPGPFGNTPY